LINIKASKIPKGLNLNNPALLCGVNDDNGIGTQKGFNYSTHFGVDITMHEITTGCASTSLKPSLSKTRGYSNSTLSEFFSYPKSTFFI